MNEFVKNIYLSLCGSPQTPKEIAKMAVMVQGMIGEDEGYEFMEKYARRGRGTYLYGEYMKERTKRILGKVTTGDGGIIL